MIQEIMSDFGKFGIQTHGLPNAIGLWPNEAECLVWAALNSGPGDWVEIGSFCGGSAVLLCLARRQLKLGPKVISVDNDFNPMFDLNVYNRGKFQDIHEKLEIDSNQLSAHLANESDIGLAFIDGYHSFDKVVDDFDQVYDWLSDDAIVIFHDTSPHFGLESHKKETLEFVKKNLELLENDKEENFRIDEAIYYICKSYGFSPITIPVKKEIGHFQETGLTKWARGTTSPFNAVVAIRKNK
jgi:predicted O-methyltransferase YrrM